MLQIENCTYVDRYKLNITFNDGTSGIANLENDIASEPYIELQDINTFKHFYLDHGAICWQNGKIDMAIEYLFYLANKNKKEWQSLFQKWGYSN